MRAITRSYVALGMNSMRQHWHGNVKPVYAGIFLPRLLARGYLTWAFVIRPSLNASLTFYILLML